MKKKKGFTLVELLAVIAILAIILLIAVPQILGVIEDAKQDSFRNSVRGVFKAAELANAKDGITQGNIEDLPLGGQAMGGKWKLENGLITLTDVTNGDYCVNSLEDNKKGDKFTLSKDCSAPPLPPVVYKETLLNGAIPELYEGLVPVLHDGTKWVVANAEIEWYKYADKKWANAVTVTESSRDKYKVAGTEVLEADVLTYLVWIPRYKYKLWNAENGNSNEQAIEIIFEDKTVAKSSGTTNGTYLTHPAFTFGSAELNGLWIGKFELTGTINNITVKPNAVALGNQTVKKFFNGIRSMENSGNQYGLNGDIVDTHMMKNMEWGVVTYLSHSIYGLNYEVRKNNSKTYTTGCAASIANGAPFDGCENAYNTTTGYLASTTGNITGIYDMSGGATEYMMAGMYNSESNTNLRTLDSGFSQDEIDALGKYIDKYLYGTTNTDAAGHARGMLGDATRETLRTFGGGSTSAWYYDQSLAPNYSRPFVIRGDMSITGGVSGGNFYWYASYGNGGPMYTSRLVITKD